MIVKAKHFEKSKSGKGHNQSKYNHISKKQAKKGKDAEDLFDEEAKNVGWEVLKNGWPDRLIYDEKSGKTYFIEIKSGKGWIKSNQKAMHKALKRVGIEVLTLRIDTTKELSGLELRNKLYDMF